MQGLETRCSLARERAELLRVHALDYDELLSLRRAQADDDRAHLAALNAHVSEQEREIARRQEARATADANAAQVAAIEERIRDAMSRARAF